MRQEIRVNFTGETTLDNGITVGVLVGLNGENVMKSGNTTQVNRAYADFSGRFGMIRIGETDSALGTDCVADPGNVTSNFGVNSPNESFSNVGYGVVRNQFTGTITPGQTTFGGTVGVAPVGEIGTCFGLESKGNRSNKILYFSPSFDGLTFGVSFTPQGASRFAGGGLAYGTDVQAPVGGARPRQCPRSRRRLRSRLRRLVSDGGRRRRMGLHGVHAGRRREPQQALLVPGRRPDRDRALVLRRLGRLLREL